VNTYDEVESKGNLFRPEYNNTNHKCAYGIFRFDLEYDLI
jgi:hypothetical protein